MSWQKQWEKLKREVLRCQKCPLAKGRKNPVFGEGDPKSGIVFIGEAPGKFEDLKGKPFVGPAGKILEENLQRVGLKREEVFITNVLKCRPPRNRDPLPEEIKTCLPYLREQLRLMKPKIIVTLGRFALRLFSKRTITEVHGEPFKVHWRKEKLKFWVLPLYHPAVALYRNSMKEVFAKDFQQIRTLLETKK